MAALMLRRKMKKMQMHRRGDGRAGKTTRSPCSLVALNRGTDLATTGIAHVMPMKLAALSVRSHYWKNPWQAIRELPFIWNGDEKDGPHNRPFVMLSTPVPMLHRLMTASDYLDTSWLIIDELHSRNIYCMLLIALYVWMRRRDDHRLGAMKLLLMSATMEDPVVTQVTQFLTESGLAAGSFVVEPEKPPPQKVELYERVDLPENWKTMDGNVRAMTTMRLMSRWIRDNWRKGAVILVFCAGQAELAGLHRKMYDAQASHQ